MKLSYTREIYELIRQAGIHSAPETLNKEELYELSANPEIRQRVIKLLSNNHRNFYQEMEMDSPYVDTHRDISYEPEALQLHSHSFYEIIYCERGNIQYLIGDKRYRIHAGDIILVPPGMSHRPIFYPEMMEPYSRIVLWISTEFVNFVSNHCEDFVLETLRTKEHHLLKTRGTDYKHIANYFHRGLLESTQRELLWEASLYANTISLVVHLCRALVSQKDSFPMENKEEIDEIISYIEKNYADRITLEDTAKEFHISTSSLTKMFANKLGISFYHFVTQRRLINSKLKIEEGSPMEEVALSCGFGDYSAFYRAFKKEYGISPREYKQMVQ